MKFLYKNIFILFSFSLFVYSYNIYDYNCSNKTNDKAFINDCKRLSDLEKIAKALDNSFKIHLNYTQPEKIHIDWSIEKGGWSTKSDLQKLVKEDFLKKLPIDPINNTNYYYFYEPLNKLELPFYQLCVSKMETTNRAYCIRPKIYNFYSDHVFIKVDIIIGDKIVRVVSANILYGGASPNAPKIISTLKEQVKLLKNIKPDIIGFQEVEVDTPKILSRNSILPINETEIDFFQKELKLSYFSYDIYKKLIAGSSGKLILSKYRIMFRKKINKQLSVVGVDIKDHNKVDLLIANIHIKLNKGKVNPTIIKKIINKSIEKMLQHFPKLPIVLVGDFRFNNLNLKKYNFIDTYKECGKKNKFGLKYKNTYISKKSRRVDYIFIRDLQCKKNTHSIILPNKIDLY